MKASQTTGVERHTTLLKAAARVSHNIASILDLNLLLSRTSDIICEEFGFYYAGVFLVDETGEWAVLKAGYGAAGYTMMAEGHKLSIGGNSMIGVAIAERQARIATNVGKEAMFFKNPHLPNTRSEMALPLIAGDDVIGALTVQSEKAKESGTLVPVGGVSKSGSGIAATGVSDRLPASSRGPALPP